MATGREQLQAEAESSAAPGNADRADARAPGSAHHREPGRRPGSDQAPGRGATSTLHAARCTLCFGERGEHGMPSSRQTCRCSCSPRKGSALRNFDRGARGRQRGDVKARAEVWAERNLSVPTGGQRPQDSARPALLTPLTYRLGGIAFEALGEPGARMSD